ncbi:response regulator [Bradyrhizobium sp. 956_D2_N1_5]|uniref:response regulator n=1 Tax=unclassified Bradyrhizobium TaxID=2631580 RepID=UPI003F27E40B
MHSSEQTRRKCSSPPVLLIDGDPGIRRSLASFFEAHNMPVRAVPDWRTSRQDFEASNLSLIVLDLPLGGDDRLRPLREIRSRSDLPIIVTTDHQCDESDRVIALEMGADDHLAKPFGMRATSTSFSVRIPEATTSSDTPSCIGVADAQASRAGQSFSGLVCGNLCTLCGRASCLFGISCASWNTRSMDHCRIREHRSRDRGYSRIIAVDHDRWMRVISDIRRFTSVRVLAE